MSTAFFAEALFAPGRRRMSGIGLGMMEQMKLRMHWLQSRQKVLSENVANSDLPGFKPKDLRPLDVSGQGKVGVERTVVAHIASLDADGLNSTHGAKKFETVPSGNAVTLEDEMTKLADTTMDYQTVTALYTKSLSLLKAAVGKA
jgi:flagellar basal-body rod protein FlgB